MKTAQYWKEYRLKNGEKLRAYKRERYAKNGARKPLEASKQEEYVEFKISFSEPPKPKPEPKTCQHAYCTREGHEVIVHGLKAWFCVEHG